MNLAIEFGGGIDTLIINNHRHLHFNITHNNTPSIDSPIHITIGNLLAFLRDNLASSKPNLLASQPINCIKTGDKLSVKVIELDKIFDLDTGVYSTPTPGVIILVNETDYELLGGVDFELKENQNIAIISTLHGG